MRWILSWRHKKRQSPIISLDCRESCGFIGQFLFLWRHDKIPRIGRIFDIKILAKKLANVF